MTQEDPSVILDEVSQIRGSKRSLSRRIETSLSTRVHSKRYVGGYRNRYNSADELDDSTKLHYIVTRQSVSYIIMNHKLLRNPQDCVVV